MTSRRRYDTMTLKSFHCSLQKAQIMKALILNQFKNRMEQLHVKLRKISLSTYRLKSLVRGKKGVKLNKLSTLIQEQVGRCPKQWTKCGRLCSVQHRVYGIMFILLLSIFMFISLFDTIIQTK